MNSQTNSKDQSVEIEEDSENEDKLVIIQPDKKHKEDIKTILTNIEGVNITQTENLITEVAKKSNLTVTNIKQILSTIINNDDVRLLVEHKIRAEGNEDLDLSRLTYKPISTRSKTKEKMIQEKVEPEKIQVLDMEFPDSSDGEDFVPENEKSLVDEEEDEAEEADDEADLVNGMIEKEPESEDHIDLIALRTRSKNPLKDTLVETIQAQLPMIDFDVNEQIVENPKTDELWDEFILTLNQPLNDNTINDEDNDSDFKYQEDEVGIDPFEMRSDKGVNISKKELKNLWSETIDSTQEQTSFGDIDFSFIMSPSDPEQQPTSPATELEAEVSNTNTQVEITHNQLSIIQDQFRMVVQIATQHFLLGVDNPDFLEISVCSVEMLNQLANFRNAVIPPNCPLYYIHNFDAAYTLVQNISSELNEKQPKVQKSSGHLSISKASQKIFYNSPVFMYPQLLPKIKFFKICKKLKFIQAEDYLIGLGLERYWEEKKNTSQTYHLISKNVLPNKTGPQIQTRVKNAKCIEKNCIKYFFEHKKCPKLRHFPIKIQPWELLAPCNRPAECLPPWMTDNGFKAIIAMPTKPKLKRNGRKKKVVTEYKPRLILPKPLNSERKPFQVLLPQNCIPSVISKDDQHLTPLNKTISLNIPDQPIIPSSPIVIQCYQNQVVTQTPSTSLSTSQTQPTVPATLAVPSSDQPTSESTPAPPPPETAPSTSDAVVQNKPKPTTNKANERKKKRRLLSESTNSKPSKRPKVSATPATVASGKKTKSSPKTQLKSKLSKGPKTKSEDEEVNSADQPDKGVATEDGDKSFDNESQEETCDEEEQALAELMHASSTISKKPSGTLLKKKVIKNIKEVEATLALLEPNILEKDPKREEKENAFVSNFFHQVLEAFNHDQTKLEVFIECLMQIKTNEKPISQVYQEVANMFKSFPILLNDFVLFLNPEQAQECGKIQEYWFYQNVLVFLRKLEIFTQNQPQQLQKILKSFKKAQEGQTTDIPSSIRHNPHLLEEFTKLIPYEKPPPAIDDQEYEVITLPDSGDEGSIDSVESIKLPEEEDLYGTKNCPCTCHSVQDKHCLKHCVQCGIKFIGGRVYLKTGNVLKPAKVVFVNGGIPEPSPNKDGSYSSPALHKLEDESVLNVSSKPVGIDVEKEIDPGEGSSAQKDPPIWNCTRDYVILAMCSQKGVSAGTFKSCSMILQVESQVISVRYEKLIENISHSSSSDPTLQALEMLEKSNIPMNPDTSWSRERDYVMLNYCQTLGGTPKAFQKAGKILGIVPSLVELRYNEVMSFVEKTSEDETMDETCESESEEESEGEEATLESTNKQHSWTKEQDYVVLSVCQEKGQKQEVYEEIAGRLNLGSWKLVRDRIKAVLVHYYSLKQSEEKDDQ